MFAALAKAAKPRLGELNAQTLMNTAFALAAAGQRDGARFAAMAKEAKLHFGSATLREHCVGVRKGGAAG